MNNPPLTDADRNVAAMLRTALEKHAATCGPCGSPDDGCDIGGMIEHAMLSLDGEAYTREPEARSQPDGVIVLRCLAQAARSSWLLESSAEGDMLRSLVADGKAALDRLVSDLRASRAQGTGEAVREACAKVADEEAASWRKVAANLGKPSPNATPFAADQHYAQIRETAAAGTGAASAARAIRALPLSAPPVAPVQQEGAPPIDAATEHAVRFIRAQLRWGQKPADLTDEDRALVAMHPWHGTLDMLDALIARLDASRAAPPVASPLGATAHESPPVAGGEDGRELPMLTEWLDARDDRDWSARRAFADNLNDPACGVQPDRGRGGFLWMVWEGRGVPSSPIAKGHTDTLAVARDQADAFIRTDPRAPGRLPDPAPSTDGDGATAPNEDNNGH